ncbi:7TM GPCR serpentine receptor class x (Srx) domain-containing protein [Caenorhabditis elegans]|uniref:7TM GPCR serpentine receptor class x (Srx) domain-containing protein n=1 Tax=Caenorhabditis elegans TaxID=6239 RepID=O44713_CAEEL|nr:7TM GPCR serpentine receptor class x (Srx) domain-containing protein [Caenorhabditis elegans]CCD67474.1 7TM GPCR serpentine receptor class x (Srx) domain-containing protein [Caenorhabditis elegans]|eukprot:NP_494624.1 Serpentine Receptor, class X [Caenorhabditis elegans]
MSNMTMDSDEISTRIVGGYMIFAASMGVLINLFMFYHFLSLEKTVFYILCSSKSISNTLVLLIYFGYIGPINAFYAAIGSDTLSGYLNQAMGFGLYLQGPTTQLMITINRFLVVWCSPVNTPRYSTRITVAAMAISWLFTVWFSTLIGMPDICRFPFSFDHVPFPDYSENDYQCVEALISFLIYYLLVLAVSTNFMNILIAIKLFCLSKSSKSLSSESAKSRRRSNIRFFLQSCFQDWICMVDVAVNHLSLEYCEMNVCAVLVSMGFDVMVYVVDGLIMYLFNYRINLKPKSTPSTRKTVKVGLINSENSLPPVSS